VRQLKMRNGSRKPSNAGDNGIGFVKSCWQAATSNL
jgi:hypothetical protein